MEPDRVAGMAQLFKAMADATRLRILGALAERPHTGKELSDRLALTPPTISHHLRKLEDVALIRTVPDAQRQWHHLNTDVLREAHRATPPVSLDERESTEADDDEAKFRTKVVRDFFDGDRLRQIPAQRKKRVVVLQHLLLRFEPNCDYPERAVNDALRTAHEDVATLRRELVDYGFMHRERGLYRVATEPPGRSVQVAQEITGDEGVWLRQLVSDAADRVWQSSSTTATTPSAPEPPR